MLAWATLGLDFDRYGGAMEGIWSKFWEDSGRGNRERTINDLHMSGHQCRDGIDHEQGIKEGVHYGMDRVVRWRVKRKSDPS
jgi:hypothetical protein